MKTSVRAAVLTAVAFSFLAGAAMAADTHKDAKTAPAAKESSKALSQADRKFLQEMAQIDLQEQKLGELAQQKAENQAVKDYGSKMHNDHSANMDQLKTLAGEESAKLPTDVDAAGKRTWDKLNKLSGAAFDHAYIQEMVTGHRKALNTLRVEEKRTKEKDIEDYAKKTATAVEEHLKLAESTNKQIANEKATKTTAGSAKKTH